MPWVPRADVIETLADLAQHAYLKKKSKSRTGKRLKNTSRYEPCNLCKKFAGHITNAAISNGWEEHETARMIYLFLGSLGMRIEKTVTFLNDLKIGSPLLLSGLCQAGTDFTPGQIILMMKVEADTDGE